MQEPTGILSLPLDGLAQMISNSTTFQTWVGADDSSDALNSIYLEAFAIENSIVPRPFALITSQAGWNMESKGYGISLSHGNMHLLFEADVSEENKASPRNATLEFTNAIGGILSELFDATFDGSAGPLITRIELLVPPQRANKKETGSDYFQTWYTVYVGVK